MSVTSPSVPKRQLVDGGWVLFEDVERTFFESPMLTVRSRMMMYEDERLREAVRETTGIDQLWRSFFASRLHFVGPITVGLGTIIKTLVRPQATTRFVRDLEDRGFRSVRRRDSRSLRLDTGREATAIEYDLTYPIDRADIATGAATEERVSDRVSGTGWLVIWHAGHDVLLSGGTYPRDVISITSSDPDARFDPTAFRADLFALIRAVSA